MRRISAFMLLAANIVIGASVSSMEECAPPSMMADFEIGNYDKIFKQIGKKEDTCSLIMKGRILSAINDNEGAWYSFSKAAYENPKSSEAWIFYGSQAKRPEQYRETVQKLIEIVRKEPNNAEAKAVLGYLYSKLNKPEIGLAMIKEALKIDKNSLIAREQLARYYRDEFDPEKVEDEIGVALATHPRNPYLLLKRGQLYYDKGAFDKSEADFAKAAKINPNFAMAYSLLGEVYAHKKEWSKAIDACNTCLSHTEIEALVNRMKRFRATYEIAAGRYTDATKHLEANLVGVERGPGMSGSDRKEMIELAICYEKLKQYDKGIAAMNVMHKLLPDSSEALDQRAQLLAGAGRYGESLKDYNVLIQKGNPTPELYKGRSSVLEKLGRKDLAEKDLVRARQLDASMTPR